MIRTGLVGVLVLLAAASALARGQPFQRGGETGAVGVYTSFMTLPAGERRARFAAMTPEDKATLVRTHMERWIQVNTRRLTAPEMAVFEEMVAYITPEIYRRGPERGVDPREEALRAKMRCRVSPADVRAATNLFARAPASEGQKATWSYLSQARCWIDWFLEELVDYIPR